MTVRQVYDEICEKAESHNKQNKNLRFDVRIADGDLQDDQDREFSLAWDSFALSVNGKDYAGPNTYSQIMDMMEEIEYGYEIGLQSANQNEKSTTGTSFIDDMDKMYDMFTMSKEDFLWSYSYLTEEDYDATSGDWEALDYNQKRAIQKRSGL